jgi:NitT/TauT family transport system substrate-binding protein
MIRWTLLVLLVIAGCEKSSSSTSTSANTATNVTLQLNWKPEPQFGGFYAAPYSKHGLEVEILPGGAGTPTVQMVGAGSVDFGIVSADEVVLARSHGNDVVALFAVYQDSPAGIMAHASRNLTGIGDVLKDGTIALLKRAVATALPSSVIALTLTWTIPAAAACPRDSSRPT